MMNEDSDADSDFDAALAIDDTSSNTDAEEFESTYGYKAKLVKEQT